MSDIIREIEAGQMKETVDAFAVGDTVKVYGKIKEGNRERIQVFEGVVLKRQGGSNRETFTVRKLSGGIGVEKTWPVHSPNVEKIEVVRRGKVRRAKLNYLRDRIGKNLLMSVGLPTIDLLSNPDNFYGMLYGTSIWKEAGWGTIIYMAAIAGVDQEMYEAAHLDGATKWQQCIYITLPAIAFAVTTMLILSVGSVLGANFDQIMNLRTDATRSTVAQVIDTYIYDMGVDKGEYDLSTAIGLFQQVVNCILLFSSNFVVKKMSGEGFF